ncbi:MAG: glycosyltransferase family 4 protein [Gemmatimonadaceae bacterium]|nr:glycosyltransferase family 4 protein [Gemmatimonadaceae bacterium]NUQ91451.1 glycosyltransferase family 4 protein [Gemmatimonadaceae bacterium]NUR20289.1 glycosyltransferase family 4 protein [Gemmatimonadaceae bacterium]NUS95978.1 glycosyltransferase family 4 protein [Gemmatimonadaceae bacterium]
MPELSGLRVGFVAGTLGQGGAERQLYYMMCALVRAGATPSLLCLTEGEFWEPRIRGLGVPITYVGAGRSRLRRLARIVAHLRHNPVDVLQSQHFYTNPYVAAAARIVGVQEIGALRSDGISEVGANSALLGRVSLRAPRRIAANSRTGIENAVSLGVPRSRLHFLPNVVDTALFRECRREREGPVRLLSVGRFVHQKRFDRFLRLLATNQNGAPRVEGHLVGDGPLRPAIERQARELTLGPESLVLHGVAADVGPYYRDADLLVLTSDWEGTPNVVLEAMASGLPVVATDVGGLADIVIDGETGFLVRPDDEEGLRQAVATLAADGAKRRSFGCRARRHVEEHHALPRLATELHRLYEASLSGGRA